MPLFLSTTRLTSVSFITHSLHCHFEIDLHPGCDAMLKRACANWPRWQAFWWLLGWGWRIPSFLAVLFCESFSPLPLTSSNLFFWRVYASFHNHPLECGQFLIVQMFPQHVPRRRSQLDCRISALPYLTGLWRSHLISPPFPSPAQQFSLTNRYKGNNLKNRSRKRSFTGCTAHKSSKRTPFYVPKPRNLPTSCLYTGQ